MIIYGRNSIEEALLENLDISEIWIDKAKSEKYPGLRKILKQKNIPVQFVAAKELDKKADTLKHQGIAGKIVLPKNIITENMVFHIDYNMFSRILVLDGVTDTGNLGAIIRSAVLLGADWILLPKDNSARITAQTIKSSAGSVYKINLAYVNNIKTEIDSMKKEGFSVIALTGEAQQVLSGLKVQKSCIILGSERDGIRKGIKALCTHKAHLPSTKRIDSFNVSVAAALAMYSLWSDIL